ncbi:MAG: leucine-rich repeat protein, partial [Prevotella sp.]
MALTWNYVLSGGKATEVTASGYAGEASIEIPATIDGYDVDSINSPTASTNFLGQTTGQTTLQNLTFASGFAGKIFNQNCFRYFINITVFSAPASVTTYKSRCLPSGILTINFPSAVSFIHFETFTECFALASITVDSGNITYKSYSGVLYEITNRLHAYPRNRPGILFVFPSWCIGANQSSFRNSNNVLTVITSNSVETLSNYAFNGSINLSKVIIGDRIKTIQDTVFTTSVKITEYNGLISNITSWGTNSYGTAVVPERIYYSANNEVIPPTVVGYQ